MTPSNHRDSVAAAIICGADWKEQEVRKMLHSLEDSVEAVFVAYNGKSKRRKDSPNRWKEFTSLPIFVEKFNWEDDFSVARNQSFEMVRNAHLPFKWILWLDTDDYIGFDPMCANPSLQGMINAADEYTTAFLCRYAYGIEPTTGEIVVEHWRERLLAADVNWKWTYPVHEVAIAPSGTQLRKAHELVIYHQRRAEEDRGTRERNRRIITRAMRENPDHPRHVFYMANEIMGEAHKENDPTERHALCVTAEELYRRYLVMSPFDDDSYMAMCRIGDLKAMDGDHNGAIDEYLIGIKAYPSWPDAFVGIARCCMELEDWGRMRDFADMASHCGKPDTQHAIENHVSSWWPTFLRAIANEQLGHLKTALNDFKLARDIWNPPARSTFYEFESLDDHIKELEKEILNKDMPLPVTFKSDVRGSKEQRKALRDTKGPNGRSICFFTNPIIEEWHPTLDKERGVGGSERMVMELSRMFARDGWRVAVFGRPPADQKGLYAPDGVEYWESNEWLAREHFDVFVGSRAANVFDAQINAELKLLWCHDATFGAVRGIERVKPDHYIALSNWHRMHLAKVHRIDPDRIRVISNGVDTSLYRHALELEKPGNRFFYSSSPDRGLDTLLGLWPSIRARIPDAQLDVAYGWEIIDRLTGLDPRHPLHMFKMRIHAMWDAIGREEGGVFFLGRVPKDDLAALQMSCSAWLYPTSFIETFCITAVEAQLAGALPVTSYLAALKETVHASIDMVDGWPLNVTYQNQWLDLFAKTMTDEYYSSTRRNLGMAYARHFDWTEIYPTWLELFAEHGIVADSYVTERASGA